MPTRSPLGTPKGAAGRLVNGGSGSLSIGLYCGGGLVGTAGGYGFKLGWDMQSPDYHAVDRSIMLEDARQYNRQLGRGASLSILSGRF